MNVGELEDYLAAFSPETLVLVSDGPVHVTYLNFARAGTVPISYPVGPCGECGHPGGDREVRMMSVPDRLTLGGWKWRGGVHAWDPPPPVRHGRIPRKALRGPRVTPAEVRTIRRLYERTQAELPPGLDLAVLELLLRLEG